MLYISIRWSCPLRLPLSLARAAAIASLFLYTHLPTYLPTQLEPGNLSATLLTRALIRLLTLVAFKQMAVRIKLWRSHGDRMGGRPPLPPGKWSEMAIRSAVRRTANKNIIRWPLSSRIRASIHTCITYLPLTHLPIYLPTYLSTHARDPPYSQYVAAFIVCRTILCYLFGGWSSSPTAIYASFSEWYPNLKWKKH